MKTSDDRPPSVKLYRGLLAVAQHRAGHAAAVIAAALFPFVCGHCGRRYRPLSKTGGLDRIDGKRLSLANFLCRDCLDDLPYVRSPLCLSCGVGFISSRGPNRVCGRCAKGQWPFDRAGAVFAYEKSVPSLVHEFKYRGNVHLAAPLGALMAAYALRRWPDLDVDRIVPVPLHGRRLRSRGFNQAELLSRQCWKWLAQRLTNAPAPTRLIRRVRHTVAQAGLKQTQRQKNIRGAFSVPEPGRVKAERILLIDDVMTTGATVNECTRVLKRAGAASVTVLTLARAQ